MNKINGCNLIFRKNGFRTNGIRAPKSPSESPNGYVRMYRRTYGRTNASKECNSRFKLSNEYVSPAF